jgi:hypothetical protein
LLQLQQFFGCGLNRKNRKAATFIVTKLSDLINVIIPHFLNYPLFTQKAVDFRLFKQIILLMQNKKHLKTEGLEQIINIRASMNLGLSDFQKDNFPNYKPVERKIIITQTIPDSY